MKDVIATEMGFFNGTRIRPGTKFSVPDNLQGKWFVPVKEYSPKPVKEHPLVEGNASRRKANSFVTAMKNVAEGTIEPEPETMSQRNKTVAPRILPEI